MSTGLAAWSQPHLTSPPMGPTDEIAKLQHRLLKAYPTHSLAPSLGVTESGIFDAATDQALRNQQAYMDGKVVTTGAGVTGIFHDTDPGYLTYATKVALGVYVPIPTSKTQCVYFSICGTGVPWNVGYCYDIGENIEPGVKVEDRKCYHQPIGYPASAFPMEDSYNAGVVEFVNQLEKHGCETMKWCCGGYSQGAIVETIVLMRVWFGDLQRFKSTYMGSISFGNPSRQTNHTIPGGVDTTGGEGVALPLMENCPENHWDFADDKGMVNSPGNDFYTKCGAKGQNAQAQADERAVWDIIKSEKVTTLALAVARLMLHPDWSGTVGAAEAIFASLNFFVVQGITPHTSYQFVQPIAGDQRDCWAIGLQHIKDLVATLPVGFP